MACYQQSRSDVLLIYVNRFGQALTLAQIHRLEGARDFGGLGGLQALNIDILAATYEGGRTL